MAEMVNRYLGYAAVTPWTVGQVPQDDLDEIYFVLDILEQKAEIAREAERRKKRRG